MVPGVVGSICCFIQNGMLYWILLLRIVILSIKFLTVGQKKKMDGSRKFLVVPGVRGSVVLIAGENDV